jgi:hypothetical protein
MPTMTNEIWAYQETITAEPLDLEGFEVAAIDGDIGKIDEATYEVGSAYLVVDTGPWIFGKKVMLPARAVEALDLDARKVVVNLTKDQIKGSPEFDEATYRDEKYRDDLSAYYGPIF